MKSVLNHVAILVESIELVLEKKIFDSTILGKIEEFPKEGTRELYIGKEDQIGKILLMQAIGAGPYQTTMEKRGAGLHHIALDVLNLDEFVAQISGSGWFLHPKSLSLYKRIKQVWLCRSGVPFLIEINESKKLKEKESFIDELHLPNSKNGLIEALSCDRLRVNNEISMRVNEEVFGIHDFIEKINQ